MRLSGIITIPLLKNYRGSEISLSNIWKNLYIIKSILTFDKNPILIYNSIPYFGTSYYCSIPFFIIGTICSLKKCYYAIKKRRFEINSVFVFWFFSVLICQLIIVEPNINKANAIFVPLIYFITSGIVYMVKRNHTVLLAAVLIFIINFGVFFTYYFYHYDGDNKYQYFFATCYLDAVEYGRKLERKNIYIDYDLTAAEYIYILLNNEVSPYNYQEDNIKVIQNDIESIYKFGIPEEVDMNAVYIIGSKEMLLKKFNDLDFCYKKFGGLTVFYKTDE